MYFLSYACERRVFRGFSKPPSRYMTNAFIMLQTNTLVGGRKMGFVLLRKMHSFSYTIVTIILVLETNTLKVCVQTSTPHSYTCSYQPFSSRAYLEIATHRHSPLKTDGSPALILTREYATPKSYIRHSVLCWTKWPSHSLS